MNSSKGHPKGLYLLFVTEMWERFSYYGMRALFMLIMDRLVNSSEHIELKGETLRHKRRGK